MLTILHWINLPRLFRCHLTFEDEPNITHYYLCEKKIGALKTKKNVYEGDPRDLNLLQSILAKLQPHIIICANLIDPEPMKIARRFCRYFVYINHSVWSDEIIAQKISIAQKTKLVEQYSIFDQLYVLKREAEMWKKLGMKPSKITEAKGLTFLDTVLIQNHLTNKQEMLKNLKQPDINPNNLTNLKTILLIHNSSSSGCKFPNGVSKTNEENSQDYAIVLKELIDLTKDKNYPIQIFTKIGRRRDTLVETDEIKQLHEQVNVIWPETNILMAKFLFADVILIQGFSTAYIEALLAHHRVIPFYVNSKVLLDQEEYPNLPVITNFEEIKPLVTQMLDNPTYFDQAPEIIAEITKMTQNTFGRSSIENVTEQIMTNLKQIFRGMYN